MLRTVTTCAAGLVVETVAEKVREVGDGDSTGDGGTLTVSVAVRVAPPEAPEMVTDVAAATPAVDTVKLALVAPAATVTLAGTEAAVALLLESVTAVPPTGAAPFRVTAPAEAVPPTTAAGLSAIEARLGARSDRGAVRVSPPWDAEMVAVEATATGRVGTAKVAVVAPWATVTLAGAETAPLSSESATTRPPAGAAAVRVTVPVTVAPPTAEAGVTVTDEIVAGGGVTDPGV